MANPRHEDKSTQPWKTQPVALASDPKLEEGWGRFSLTFPEQKTARVVAATQGPP
jgi:hypothetical protein